MKRLCLVMLLINTFSYVQCAECSVQYAEPKSLANVNPFILHLKIKMIGMVVPSDEKITWSDKNTFIEYELVAIKSDDGKLCYGMVKTKDYGWIIFTDTFSTFASVHIARLPKECNLTQGDVGKLVDEEVAANIKWNPLDTYEPCEMVVVKCADGTIKYGCIHKKEEEALGWLVAHKSSDGKIIFDVFKSEEIGKLVDNDI
jgi:hypothetical protein